jgi:hypothetical protein
MGSKCPFLEVSLYIIMSIEGGVREILAEEDNEFGHT